MKVLVIGGSRYFGRRLVDLLHAAGLDVTVLNRGSSAPPDGVRHLVADRDDPAALHAALAGEEFDVVYDQVCYTPVQAATALRVIRVGRYVLTSTVEVYFPRTGDAAATSLGEERFDPAAWPVDLDAGSWEYGEGKRQAEAVFSRAEGLDLVTVRCAHVLGGDDFTGRLAHYVTRIRAGEPVVVHAEPTPASFIRDVELADVLVWAGGATVTGALNAASTGALDARDLCEAIGARVGREPVYSTEGPASPYSFEASLPIDTARAARHGFAFSSVADWLPDVLDEVR